MSRVEKARRTPAHWRGWRERRCPRHCRDRASIGTARGIS